MPDQTVTPVVSAQLRVTAADVLKEATDTTPGLYAVELTFKSARAVLAFQNGPVVFTTEDAALAEQLALGKTFDLVLGTIVPPETP